MPLSASTDWGLGSLWAIAHIAPKLGLLAPKDADGLREGLASGTCAVAPPAVRAVLSGSSSTDALLYGGLVQKRGTLDAALKMSAALCGNGRHDLLAPFWKDLQELRTPQPG